MAAAPDPDEVLHSTTGKENFQRVARLLISGGTMLLREIFDTKCSPSNLPTKLNNAATKKQLKAAKLTKPQWDCLYPSPGAYGKSSDFDVTLLFRLLRTICSLTPPVTGWDTLPANTDHCLAADLARIKYYRNSVYGHVRQDMEVTDDEFPQLWQEISEALIRIAGQISPEKKKQWQVAIINFLKKPLTAEDERNVQELKEWYKNDMEVKESMEELNHEVKSGMQQLKTATQEIKDQLGEVIKDKFNSSEGGAVTGNAERVTASVVSGSCTSLNEAECHNDRGRVEFKEGRYENACQQYTNALKCLPVNQENKNRVKYLNNRATCYLKLNKFQNAHLDCDSALMIDPHHTKARFNLAKALEGEGKNAEAFMEVTSIYQKNKQDKGIAKLESSLKKKIEDGRRKAIEKRGQGNSYFVNKKYDEAVTKFKEGILLMPCIPEYKEERKSLYWGLAECRLKMRNFEATLRDCEEADRLCPGDIMVLLTKKNALEPLERYEECYKVCHQLLEKKYKVKEAKETMKRLLVKMEKKSKQLKQEEESSQKTSLAKVNGTKKSTQAKRETEKPEDTPLANTEVNAKSADSNVAGTLATGSQDVETNEDTPLANTEVNAKSEDSNVAGTLATGSQDVETRTESQFVNKSKHEECLQLMQSNRAESEPEMDEVDEGLLEWVTRNKSSISKTVKVKKSEMTIARSARELNDDAVPVTGQEYAETMKTIRTTHRSSQLRKAKDQVFPKPVVGIPPSMQTHKEPSEGEAYPRRILFICTRWSSWHRSACTVNKQLCQGFAKVDGVHVACLVLDATDQEKVEAAKDGVILIKAADQPGTSPGDEKLLSLHNNVPFKVDLVVGHGTDSGAAAAILAQRLKCSLLHVFHSLPVEDEDYGIGSMAAEIDVALKADFVAGVGPLVVEQWSMIINRQVHMIIPGMPKVLPRNKIPTPQSRCLILGIMDNLAMGGLNLATNALAVCKKQEHPIHLTVLGAHREKVGELQEHIKKQCHSLVCRPVVKPFEVSREIVEVEIRGVSLVLMPSPSDGFGMLALDAFAANVPVLISSSSGLAKFLEQEFGSCFLKFLCPSEDGFDDWSNAIDEILEDREKSFTLAASLRDQWNSKFTWESTTNDLLGHLGRSGQFSVQSPLATQDILLPSQCSDFALTFMEAEVDLLNRRRKHVLFISPENADSSPFIRYFAQVPWIAVFDFDVNSVATGYLASCESFCESMGIKICRMLPPLPDDGRKKISVTLPNGMPWVLLEGIPESKRNVKENLEWIREFFIALGRNYPGPITFIVLWRSAKETKVLCKNLSKILTVVQGSSLERQVKVIIASTAHKEDEALEDIAEDWGTEVHKFGLEDICNALYQCVSSSPFIQENQDFALPVADPDDPQQVSSKVLPPSRRWINAEMEVLYQSVGSTPQFDDDASHFYRGGLISWYALQMGYAVERGNWKALDQRVQELLQKAGTMKLKMPHQRGAGGTTTARKILFDFHEKYPCVFLKSVNQAEIAPAIKVLTEFCRLPVIILVDCKHIQSDEFDVDSLFNSLSNDRIPCVILEVIHQSQQRERSFSERFEKSEKTTPIRLADTLTHEEAQEFVKIYSNQNKNKQAALRSLQIEQQIELQIPFFYALITFEERFTALEPFVKECLQDLSSKKRDVLLFLAMTYHYGHSSLSANDFAGLLQAPRREVLSLESVLPDLSVELLLEEDGKWRPRHDLIALEMLRQLLTMPDDDDGVPKTHPDNWRNQLADKAVICFSHMPETVVSDMLLSRVTDDNTHQPFSQLISDIPLDEDAIRLFEKAISLFPDNPFFKVHLGRFYSIRKKSAGFTLAIKYTNEGIACADDYPSRVVRGQFAQMKGVVYSREVHNLSEANDEITNIIEIADEGVKNFRRAVSIAPDLVDGYIPEVRMMCKLFEHIDRTKGSFHDYVKSQDAHRFIIDAISNTSDTLECVPDSDAYSYWRMRLACVGCRKLTPENLEEALKLALHLRSSDRASRGPINRRIVTLKMEAQSRKGQPMADIAHDLIQLLNEALRYDSNVIEHTMRLWVRLAPFISVDLLESEEKIFHWCLKEKSVRSYLYKYIVACLRLLGRRAVTVGSWRSSYSEIMKNAKDDLNSEIKAINRSDVGRCRHPDRPVVWLGHEASGMGNLVYLDEKISELVDVRMKRFIASKYTKHLRPLTGRIVETGNKVGAIRVNDELDVSFRADLCETPLTGSGFVNRKVKFFLAFTFFGTDAYNVQLVPEKLDRDYLS